MISSREPLRAGDLHSLFRDILRHRDDIGNFQLQCSSHCRHPHPGCSRAAKNPRALRSRSSRGIDIIDQYEVAIQYSRWIAHRKSAAHVLAPLMSSQANLAPDLAAAQQDSRASIESFRARQLCLLARVQGNADNRDFAGEERSNRHHLFQVGDSLGQHASQNRRRTTKPAETWADGSGRAIHGHSCRRRPPARTEDRCAGRAGTGSQLQSDPPLSVRSLRDPLLSDQNEPERARLHRKPCSMTPAGASARSNTFHKREVGKL